MSLLLFNIRFDGFGYDRHFIDVHGVRCAGWHRHFWDGGKLNARGRVSAELWPAAMTFEEFLVRAFAEMNICCEVNYENSLL